jgi:uncharacterized membrane protein YqjE
VSYQSNGGSRFTGDGVPHTVASIPLVDADARGPGQPSIGELVKDASAQVSTLIRAEVELAKSEVASEVKKGVKGSVFFVIAAAIGLFSLFFLFFFAAELLAVWLPRWAAFLIVFAVMLVAAGVAALLGYLRVRSIKKPEHTIESVKELATVLPNKEPAQPALTKPAASN